MQFSTFSTIVLMAVPIIFAITVHEVAHGWIAKQLGDDTAASNGRLTLNPVKHMDPIGTVFVPFILVLFGHSPFGWARPVPVDWHNLRQPKRDMALVAIAGPAANLCMLLVWIGVLKAALFYGHAASVPQAAIVVMAEAGIVINSILMILNLFPIPPLDGSRVVTAFLPNRLARIYVKVEPVGLIVVLLLFFTGYLGKWLMPVINGFNSFIYSWLI